MSQAASAPSLSPRPGPILGTPLKDLFRAHSGNLSFIVALVGEKALPHEATAQAGTKPLQRRLIKTLLSHNPRPITQMQPSPRLSPHGSPLRPSLGLHPTKDRDRVQAIHDLLRSIEECDLSDLGLRGLFAVCMNRASGQTESEKGVVAQLQAESKEVTFDLLLEAALKITGQAGIPFKDFPLSSEQIFPLQWALDLIVQALAEQGERIALTLLAKIFMQKNDFVKAKESLDRLISQQFLNSFARIQRGIFLSQGKLGITQDLEEAIVDFKTVLNQTNAKREQVLELLADVLCQKGITQDLTEAQDLYSKLLKSDPHNATANAALAHLSSSNVGHKQKYLPKARAHGPANQGVRKVGRKEKLANGKSPDDFPAVITYLADRHDMPKKIALLKEVYGIQKDNIEFMAQLAVHVNKKHPTILLKEVVEKDLTNKQIVEFYIAQLFLQNPQSLILKELKGKI